MYDKRAKQDAQDLWFSMPGEMSVDDFAAELGYPSGSTLRNWIKADPVHDPDMRQYRPSPCLPKLEAIRRVAEGATAAQAAWETGPDPSAGALQRGRYARGGTAAFLLPRPRGRGGRERPWRGRPAGRAGRPARCPAGSSRRGCRRGCPTTRRRSRRSSPTRAQQRRAQGGVGRPKAGAPAPTNAERRPAAPPARGRLRRRGRLRGPGPARSTYYYQLDALHLASAPPDGTAGEMSGPSASTAELVVEGLPVRARGCVARRGRLVSEKAQGGGSCAGSGCACATRAGGATAPTPARSTPAPNLLLRADGTHDFSAGRPNEAWVSDVTEFRRARRRPQGVPVARRRPVRRQACLLGRRHQP